MAAAARLAAAAAPPPLPFAEECEVAGYELDGLPHEHFEAAAERFEDLALYFMRFYGSTDPIWTGTTTLPPDHVPVVAPQC